MATQSTKLSPSQLIAAAKAPLLAYNEKNWAAIKASVTPDLVYDEVATQQRAQGPDQVITAWQGWATALPDSKATFNSAQVSGDNVVFEVTWKGTHQGPLQTPKGPIAATGKRIEVRACFVCETAGEKVKLLRHYFDMGTILQQLGV